MGRKEPLCKVSSLYLYESLRYEQNKFAMVISSLHMVPPGASKLNTLSQKENQNYINNKILGVKPEEKNWHNYRQITNMTIIYL